VNYVDGTHLKLAKLDYKEEEESVLVEYDAACSAGKGNLVLDVTCCPHVPTG
jgi:hypothetical protein